jgi:hypothetical protein
MRRALKIGGWSIGFPATLLVLLMTLSWSKRHLDWFATVKNSKLTIDGQANPRMSLFRSTYARFASLPTRTIVLIQRSSGQKQTYVILGPGPGHLPEGFKGSIWRCESVFVGTPLFGFANNRWECGTPNPNRDQNRNATFDSRFVEFTADDGKRLRVEW